MRARESTMSGTLTARVRGRGSGPSIRRRVGAALDPATVHSGERSAHTGHVENAQRIRGFLGAEHVRAAHIVTVPQHVRLLLGRSPARTRLCMPPCDRTCSARGL
eukprot:6782627-Prymnesium_polylepis.1